MIFTSLFCWVHNFSNTSTSYYYAILHEFVVVIVVVANTDTLKSPKNQRLVIDWFHCRDGKVQYFCMSVKVCKSLFFNVFAVLQITYLTTFPHKFSGFGGKVVVSLSFYFTDFTFSPEHSMYVKPLHFHKVLLLLVFLSKQLHYIFFDHQKIFEP